VENGSDEREREWMKWNKFMFVVIKRWEEG
jgi:hypothetical protein